MKSKRVCIKTRSPPASLPIKGQDTKHTTVKWTIALSKARGPLYAADVPREKVKKKII